MNVVQQVAARNADYKAQLYFDDIARRGITTEQAQYAGIEFTANARRDVAPEFKALAASRLFYFDITGAQVAVERDGEGCQFERVRYLEEGPQGFTKKPPQKYAQPARTRAFAFLPRVVGLDWRAVASDPSQPIVITEGEFKALCASLAGFPTVGLGGVFNFIHDGSILPELQPFAANGRQVYIVHDHDPKAKTRRHVALAARRLAAELIKRGAIAHIVHLPALVAGGKTALDDFLADPNSGPEELEKLLINTPPADPNATLIMAGTDVEIADAVLRDLEDAYGSAVVFCDGAFYAFCGTHWDELPDNVIANTIYRFDRTPFGQSGMVKLSDGRAKSVLAIMRNRVADADFFVEAPEGINAANGFIRFDGDGTPSMETHDREQSQRHCLPGSWMPGADWSSARLLNKLLRGCFCDDSDFAERVALIAEVCGVAALGAATRLTSPRAVVLFGASAENGKSEILALVSGLLSRDAICSVPPARFGDERMLVKLSGARSTR